MERVRAVAELPQQAAACCLPLCGAASLLQDCPSSCNTKNTRRGTYSGVDVHTTLTPYSHGIRRQLPCHCKLTGSRLLPHSYDDSYGTATACTTPTPCPARHEVSPGIQRTCGISGHSRACQHGLHILVTAQAAAVEVELLHPFQQLLHSCLHLVVQAVLVPLQPGVLLPLRADVLQQPLGKCVGGCCQGQRSLQACNVVQAELRYALLQLRACRRPVLVVLPADGLLALTPAARSSTCGMQRAEVL